MKWNVLQRIFINLNGIFNQSNFSQFSIFDKIGFNTLLTTRLLTLRWVWVEAIRGPYLPRVSHYSGEKEGDNATS